MNLARVANRYRRFNRKCGAKLLQPGDTWARGVAIRLEYTAVIEGLVSAAKEMREAMEGRSPQRLEISATPRKTEIVLVVKYDRRNALIRSKTRAKQMRQNRTDMRKVIDIFVN